ncbi:MAG: hypothetical protein IJE93_08625 [Clostridia bacterium]|nr:hypothetical protein [Clostridia bacterium]
MKKFKLSVVEKRFIRCIFVFVLIQMFIVLLFLQLFRNGQAVKIEETKQADIIVEDIYIQIAPGENLLFIIADSGRYNFAIHSMFEKYSFRELEEIISEGDKLTVRYYEGYTIFGKTKSIVDMRSETEIYRSFEDYTRAFRGVPTFIVILFSVIELIFAGIVILYFWLEQNISKGLYRKIKKHLSRKQKAKH